MSAATALLDALEPGRDGDPVEVADVGDVGAPGGLDRAVVARDPKAGAADAGGVGASAGIEAAPSDVPSPKSPLSPVDTLTAMPCAAALRITALKARAVAGL